MCAQSCIFVQAKHLDIHVAERIRRFQSSDFLITVATALVATALAVFNFHRPIGGNWPLIRHHVGKCVLQRFAQFLCDISCHNYALYHAYTPNPKGMQSTSPRTSPVSNPRRARSHSKLFVELSTTICLKPQTASASLYSSTPM